MSKLDSFFCNEDWDIQFGSHLLHALSSSLSDHCPLLLASDVGPSQPKCFRFENFWIKMPNFKKTVQDAWNERVPHVEPCQILFHKLKRASQRLRTWSKKIFSNHKVQLPMALEIILSLDLAQESRTLSSEERDLRSKLKKDSGPCCSRESQKETELQGYFA